MPVNKRGKYDEDLSDVSASEQLERLRRGRQPIQNPLVDALNRLNKVDEEVQKKLNPPKDKKQIKAKTGKASETGVSKGSGIASPLTEVEGNREYHPVQNIISSDGLFSIEVQNLSFLLVMDSNNAEVEFYFKDIDLTGP